MAKRRAAERDGFILMLCRQLPGAMWTTDRDLRLTYVTGRLTNNMEPRARVGMLISDVVGTEDPANRVLAYHRAAMAGKPQSFHYKLRDRWYEVFVEQLKDENESVAGCIAAAFDVTEQRATQDRLARSEALLAQAQRMAHIGSFEWDMASNAVTWSDELHRIYGVPPGQFAGTYEAFLERVHPDDLEHTKGVIFDALRNGTPFVYEHRIVRGDGSTRVLQTRGDIVRDKDGRAVRMAGCCLDITELKDAMANLQRVRSLLEATIEATADGLLVVNDKSLISVFNQRFLSLWRIPQDLAREHDDEKLLNYVCDQLENPDQFMRSTRELYLHPEQESFDVQHFKDGRVFERYSRPQRIGEQIAGRVWSFRDVTERETLLRRALFLADATRLLSSLDVEPALDSVAHLSVPFLGDGCAIDLIGDGQPRRLLFVSREGSDLCSPEFQTTVLAGHPAIYSAGARPCMAVPLVVKEAVAGAMTFIGPALTSYRQADLEFAETVAHRAALSVENAMLYGKAREALKARDEFLTIAAHEIRGPITSIHIAVQALLAGKSQASETSKLLAIIEREDRRLGRFVNELLDLGKIQTGPIRFNLQEVDLGDVVREAASNLSAELARSHSALSIVVEGRLVGQWDREGLAEVAANLLSNAIKFGEGKPIAITVREQQGRSVLRVQDHGIGIQPEMLSRLFKPFERGVSTRNYGGLGLGLFISRTIVEGLGGTLKVESRPKEGTTFSVELPNTRTL
ncbi:MAG TPA: ATP-binding protein [Terriglobia bacterium]|jgi:PAS domain S-box-containing protein